MQQQNGQTGHTIVLEECPKKTGIAHTKTNNDTICRMSHSRFSFKESLLPPHRLWHHSLPPLEISAHQYIQGEPLLLPLTHTNWINTNNEPSLQDIMYNSSNSVKWTLNEPSLTVNKRRHAGCAARKKQWTLRVQVNNIDSSNEQVFYFGIVCRESENERD